ncbi:hypothetical protein CPSG_05754 [Coccidioides posadasii str. Silveira]|uniref:Uncharacterized protein n=1 Tax=Coccidioides posadasii (strain RMSCC 757 / Silveira) TaxID=443226 RepID=E9D7F2_COCPS|nr:hypothetical protein CPSG_05754 [Coccidioides posadasii str. Silveira]
MNFQVNEERRANRHSRPPPTEKSAERDWLDEARNGGWERGRRINSCFSISPFSPPSTAAPFFFFVLANRRTFSPGGRLCSPPRQRWGRQGRWQMLVTKVMLELKHTQPCGIESWVPLTNVRSKIVSYLVR